MRVKVHKIELMAKGFRVVVDIVLWKEIDDLEEVYKVIQKFEGQKFNLIQAIFMVIRAWTGLGKVKKKKRRR